ncbi:MAG: twin transmembrane helix small protein [Henriciella sp.]|jgi:hypothetical protein
MTTLLQYGFYLALLALVIVLGLGLANLTRSDDKQASRSNRLMRLRVLMQAIAIGFLVLLGVALGAIGG